METEDTQEQGEKLEDPRHDEQRGIVGDDAPQPAEGDPSSEGADAPDSDPPAAPDVTPPAEAPAGDVSPPEGQ